VKKLETDGYDAVVLAAAGLLRLGMEKRITEYFDAEIMMPAPGQGALAVELREGNSELATLVAKIDHRETSLAAKIERAFAKRAGGGCKEPVGAYAVIAGNTITLQGMLATDDGTRIVRGSINGATKDGVALAETLAAQLLGKLGQNDARV
jgi:hydroxymethylbilane synthase